MISTGVQFGDIHSYDDLDLLFAPFVIPPAVPKTNFLDIPAGDGSLDLTEALGEVRYNDREFVMEFTVNPYSEMTFDEKIMQVSNLLNGKEFDITFDRDSDWYWQGRCIINEHLQDKMINKIIIKAIVRPYKLKHELTEYTFHISSSIRTVHTVINSGRKTIVPNIYCEMYPIYLTFDDVTYTINSFGAKILELQLKEGENEIGLQLKKNDVTEYTNVYLEFKEGNL